MEIVIKALQFFLSLSILVLLHELGHFTFARIFKTRVEKFYLFFNPWFTLFKFKKGDTEYGFGWLPLGGYVKIAGMIDESMDKEQMKLPPQPYEFRSKPAWQRLLIITGGVLVNLILGFIIYIAIVFTWGKEYLPTNNATYGIAVDSLGYKIGLRNGDKIISLENKPVEDFYQIYGTIMLNQSTNIQVLRDTQKLSITIPSWAITSMLKNHDILFDLRRPFYIEGFSKESKVKDAGLKPGDRIIGLNNQSTLYFDEFKSNIAKLKNQKVTVVALREKDTLKIETTVPETGLLGISSAGDLSKYFEVKKITYGFFESIPVGIASGFKTLADYVKQFKLIFSREHKGYESLGGFITIGNIFSGTWDWQVFWHRTAFLSLILAFMNFLPIPALDGGYVLFILYEMITRRKPGEKFLEYAQTAGMIFVLALVLYANLNDIIKLFFK